MNKKIELIIQRYFDKSISKKELLILEEWMLEEKNKKIFKDYVDIQYLLNYKYQNSDSNKIENQIKSILEREKVISLSKRTNYSKLLKYAAVFIGLVSLSIFTRNKFLNEEGFKNTITIQLENGDVEYISESEERKIIDKDGAVLGIQKGKTLTYAKQITGVKQGAEDKLMYNKLTIPYGKVFKLELYDGTIVHLNSGTSFKYPVKFLKGKKRKVFLEGEAFFEVAKDKENPFVVNAKEMNVIALGTEFNVSSYKEDTKTSTVLVEGSVGVYKKDEEFNRKKSIILKPNQKADLNNENKIISVETVDVRIFTGWINGELIFNHVTFSKIRKMLERHYNVEIINNNIQLEKEIFTATFDTESIQEVLEAFNKNYSIKYIINENKIIIN